MNLFFYVLLIGIGTTVIFITDFKTWRDHALKACGCILVALGTYLVGQHFS